MSAEEVKVGLFQVVLIFLLGINYIIVSMNDALPGFHSYTPNFYCKVRGSANTTNKCLTSSELSTTSNSTLSVVSDNVGEYSSCETGYRFDSVRGETTIVTEWALICERSYLLPLSTTVYFCGVVIGAWIAGVLADRVGRLPVLAMCLYTQGTLAVALYIIQDYRAFLVVRALQGVFVQGLQISTYTLLLELFPVRARTLVGMSLQFFWALGLLLLSGLSYAVADWRVLQLATSVPTAVTVLYIWIIPESPRWLLAKGKLTEAHMALENIAKYNTCCRKPKGEADAAEAEDANGTTITESSTPVKPKRKSRISCNADNSDAKISDISLPEEAAMNLLSPAESNEDKISVQETDMITSSESLERRISNLEMQLGLEMFRDEPKEETPVVVLSSLTNEDDRSSIGSKVNQKVLTDEAGGTIELRKAEAVIPQEKKEEGNGVRKEKKDEDIERKHDVAADQNFLQILRRPRLRRNCLVMVFVWFSLSLAYCGTFHLPNITIDRHVNFAIGGSLDLVAYAVTYFLLTKFERRLPLCIYLILSGAICIVTGAISLPIHKSGSWTGPTILTLVLIGKGAIVSSFTVMSLYTVEMFPTVLRGTGLGLGEIANKIGSLIAPQLIILGAGTSVAVPTALMGVLCIASGVFSLSLPKTSDAPLADTIEQSENMCGKKCSKELITVDEEEPLRKSNNKKRNAAVDEQTERDILREKLFSNDNGGKTWVDAGNGIIVNFSDSKNSE